ncbi:hypothetical protein MKX01_002201 [Papaver californicum]|nr:hypothetical protein MKX01_002201 [Papaver californicum]
MKTTTTSLLLIFAFISLAIFVQFSTVSAASEAVRDMDGDPLRKGVKYYIIPNNIGGGLVLGLYLNGTECPRQVVQSQREVSNGLPLTFTSVDPKAKVILVETDLNIEYSGATSICPQYSKVWRLADFDESVSRWFIETNGVAGNPGPSTTGNWFKIEKDGVTKNGYKLKFCPSVCNFCKVICKEVGVYRGVDEVRRFALINDGEEPITIFFRKA